MLFLIWCLPSANPRKKYDAPVWVRNELRHEVLLLLEACGRPGEGKGNPHHRHYRRPARPTMREQGPCRRRSSNTAKITSMAKATAQKA